MQGGNQGGGGSRGGRGRGGGSGRGGGNGRGGGSGRDGKNGAINSGNGSSNTSKADGNTGRGRGRGGGGKIFHGGGRSTGTGDVDETFRIEADIALREFRSNEEHSEITFPSTLTNTERQYVHYVCSTLGLHSKSSGKGEARCLTVRRKNTAGGEGGRGEGGGGEKSGPRIDTIEGIDKLVLRPRTVALLENYLERYPPRASDFTPLSSSLSSQSTFVYGNGKADRRITNSFPRIAPLPGTLPGVDPIVRTEMKNVRESLPAAAVRDQVINYMKTHRLMIVSGDTGCGKSTQIPQFILEGEPTANIIVTQPRRISAISLAERVAAERCESVGGTVGYNVRLESATSNETQLLFCTTGVLLRRLVNDRYLDGITHVIVDEVHERDIDSDFLLIILRDLLPIRDDLKVVIMSATLHLDLFLKYFSEQKIQSVVPIPISQGVKELKRPSTTSSQKEERKSLSIHPLKNEPATIHIQGSMFPVTRFFLEDVLLETNYIVGRGNNGGSGGGGGGGGGGGSVDSLIASLKAKVPPPLTLLPPTLNELSTQTTQSVSTSELSRQSIINKKVSSQQARIKDELESSKTTAALFVCSCCGRNRFKDIDAFSFHAAICFGPDTAGIDDDDDEEEEEIETREEDENLKSKNDIEKVDELVTPITALPSTSVSKSSIILPGGAKAKKEALLNASSAAISGNGSGGGGESLLDPEIEKMVETYQKSVDEDEVDVLLVQALLVKIVKDIFDGIGSITGSTSVNKGVAKGNLLSSSTPLGAILVFLPGWEEISKMMELMRAHTFLGNTSRVLCLPLHSQVPTSEQRRVFRHPPQGIVKIILATNIAETSITIDDIVYVVDTGRVREKSFDAYTGCSSLTSVWCSKASSRQRAGRAGRVRAGFAYHLFSRKRHTSLSDFSIPAMLRTPLDELCLQIKLLSLTSTGDYRKSNNSHIYGVESKKETSQQYSEIESFLRRAIQPPELNAIRAAVTLLRSIGALEVVKHTSSMIDDDILTPLGRRLAELPLSPRLGKILLIAIGLKCLDPVLTIVCAMSVRPPYVLPMYPGDRERANKAKEILSNHTRSDHITLLNAVNRFFEARRRGGGIPFNREEVSFCNEFFLSSASLNMIIEMRSQILEELIKSGVLGGGNGGGGREGEGGGGGEQAVGFYPLGIKKPLHIQALASVSINSQSMSLIKAALSAGLFPNIAKSSLVLETTTTSGNSIKRKEIGGEQKSINKIETRGNTKVNIHPSSINCYGGGKLLHACRDKIEWVLFDEMSTFGTFGAVSIRGTTVVQGLVLFLLCGGTGRGSGEDMVSSYERFIRMEALRLMRRDTGVIDSKVLVECICKNVRGVDEGGQVQDEEGEGERGDINPVCQFGDQWGKLIIQPSSAIPLLVLQRRFEDAMYRSVIASGREVRVKGRGGGGSGVEDEEVLKIVAQILAEE